jgi:hypothetical protein
MKSSKVILPLLLLAVLPVLLLATQTANLSVLFNIDTDIPYQQAVMDTDSTLCLYNVSSSVPLQTILTVRRVHADGFIEPQQTLFSLPVDTADPYIPGYIPNEGKSISFVFVNSAEIILILVSGTDATSYSTPNVAEVPRFTTYILFNNSLAFIGGDLYYPDQLWVWNYLDEDIYPVYDYPLGHYPHVARLGTDRLLISIGQWADTPEQNPAMLMDSQFNLSPTNVYNKVISPTYSFDENHFYANWHLYDYPGSDADCSGVMSVDSGNFTFETWSDFGPMDPWGEGYHFRFALPGNLHACIYSWAGMSSPDFSSYEIYSYDGQGNVDLYTGFPQISNDPSSPKYMGLYQDKLLLIYYADEQHDFRLADTVNQEWIPVVGSPIDWTDPRSENFRFMNSDHYIYGIYKTYDGPLTLTCLKLDISVSTDDPVAAPPALRAYPNPFKSSVKLEFDSIDTCPAVEIYNLRGQKVRTLLSQPDGTLWDGKDASGNRLSSGIYFARPQTGSRKVLKLLKLGD